MTVANNQLANQSVFNAAFVSRTAAQTVAGGKRFEDYIALEREDVASAATIAALSSTNSYVKLTGATATELQGITAGVNGQLLFLYNDSSAIVTVKHESGSASAANRIDIQDDLDVVIPSESGAEFIYDSGQSRWVLLSISRVPDASTTVRGVVSIGTQTLGGAKTFANAVTQSVPGVLTPKSVATDANIPALAIATPIIRLSGATQDRDIQGIAVATSGTVITLFNATAFDYVLKHESGSATDATNRLTLPSATDVSLSPNSCISLHYDGSSSRWLTIGGTGGGGSSRYVDVFTGTSFTPTASTSQTWLYTGGSAQTFSGSGFGTIASLTEGTQITIMGSSDSNTLSIAENDAADGWLIGGDIILRKGGFITFEYNSTLARMVQVGRSQDA